MLSITQMRGYNLADCYPPVNGRAEGCTIGHDNVGRDKIASVSDRTCFCYEFRTLLGADRQPDGRANNIMTGLHPTVDRYSK